jgi:hypothetical protein
MDANFGGGVSMRSELPLTPRRVVLTMDDG